MNILITKKSTTESIIKIKIVQNDYSSKVENRINDIKPKLNLKGFRPGKVPVQLIKKMYGKSILIEEINKLTSHELTNYIREKKINLIGEPVAEKSNENKIDWDKQSDFEFKFRIGMVSEFKLETFSKKIKFNKYDIKIDKKIVSETIQNFDADGVGLIEGSGYFVGQFGSSIPEAALTGYATWQAKTLAGAGI